MNSRFPFVVGMSIRQNQQNFSSDVSSYQSLDEMASLISSLDIDLWILSKIVRSKSSAVVVKLGQE